MKRLALLAGALSLSAVLASTGCLVSRHGHVAMVPPPALIAAAAVAAAVATRPGYVWVDGHWDWQGDRWVWTEGEWIAERPGFVWVPGLWLHVGGEYRYRPGRWQAREDVHIRDHRRR